MVMMISQSEKDYECQFCKRSFTREKTLAAHVCEPKRRHQQKDEKHVQIAYIAYKRFYELTQGSSNFKTYEHFAQSQYYNAFVKFGNHIININVINPDYFIDYVIRSNTKLDHWCKDAVYEEYLLPYIKTENVRDALERSIITMEKWATENDAQFNHFFKFVSFNKAVALIRNGKISPWIIYNSKTGMEMLEKMTDEQLGLINDFIDPIYWSRRFEAFVSDVEWVKHILSDANM
jgi:hypothetical protein